MISVISLVGKQGLRFNEHQKRLGLLDVVDFAASEAERQWVAYRIDNHMDFRREPAA